VSVLRWMLAKVLGEHGLWVRLTGPLERWARRGGRCSTPGGAGFVGGVPCSRLARSLLGALWLRRRGLESRSLVNG